MSSLAKPYVKAGLAARNEAGARQGIEAAASSWEQRERRLQLRDSPLSTRLGSDIFSMPRRRVKLTPMVLLQHVIFIAVALSVFSR